MINYMVTLLKMGLILPFLRHSRGKFGADPRDSFSMMSFFFVIVVVFYLLAFAVTLERAENFLFPTWHGSIYPTLDHLGLLARVRKSIF